MQLLLFLQHQIVFAAVVAGAGRGDTCTYPPVIVVVINVPIVVIDITAVIRTASCNTRQITPKNRVLVRQEINTTTASYSSSRGREVAVVAAIVASSILLLSFSATALGPWFLRHSKLR